VGDLGNFKTDGQGNAKGSTSDKQIKLIGQDSVLGVSGNRSPSYHPESANTCSALLSFTPAPTI
jgi:superoxide dismutase, Cu-Zn family